ncbi:MAG TPA: multicopper oxidase domain-containing protein, partial [Candidatus Tumulicola sp.]
MLAASVFLHARALADVDEQPSVNASTLGMQPLRGQVPKATAAPGESSIFRRPDGAYQARPDAHGRTKVFHIVERAAPWTISPGLSVMANTYNGVVPGPVMSVDQGDTVVIDYYNDG